MANFTNEIFLRPRFKIAVATSKEALLGRFKRNLEQEESSYPFKMVDAHIFIDIPKKDNHFWSPQLHLEVIEEDGQTILKGLFGPKPQVWTLFMFVHFVVGITFLIFATLAYVNSTLEKSNVLPIAMVIALPLVWILLYVLGSIGKGTGKGQIRKLQKFTLTVLNKE